MKHLFIINPTSGKGNDKQALGERILKCAKAKGVEAEVRCAEHACDAADYIADFAARYEKEEIRIYACGGDGTLCKAVNGIMRLENREKISLGVLPVGTGNDFVRNFGERELFLNIEAQLDAAPKRIDLLRCNDIYCINMINIGFDCQVVVRTATIKKRKLIPSKLAYIFGLLITLIKKPGTRITLSGDGGETQKKELLLSTFANGGYCGGGFYSNPEASLKDGKVNALFVKNISRTAFLGLVSKYKKGEHLSGKYDHILSSEKSSAYHLVFDTPTEISVDGEIFTLDRADIECMKGALSFLVPSDVKQ